MFDVREMVKRASRRAEAQVYQACWSRQLKRAANPVPVQAPPSTTVTTRRPRSDPGKGLASITVTDPSVTPPADIPAANPSVPPPADIPAASQPVTPTADTPAAKQPVTSPADKPAAKQVSFWQGAGDAAGRLADDAAVALGLGGRVNKPAPAAATSAQAVPFATVLQAYDVSKLNQGITDAAQAAKSAMGRVFEDKKLALQNSAPEVTWSEPLVFAAFHAEELGNRQKALEEAAAVQPNTAAATDAAAACMAQIVRMKSHVNQSTDDPGSQQAAEWMSQEANEALGGLRRTMQVMGSDQWTPKQWNEYKGKVTQYTAPGSNLPGRVAVGASIDDAVRGEGVEQTKAALAVMNDQANKDFNWNGLGDWFMSNWQNFLVPASIIGMLFGGNVGRILGVLGLAGGAFDLYNRYNNVAGDPKTNPNAKHVQAVIAQQVETAAAARRKNPADTTNPFAEPEKAVADYLERLAIEEPGAAQEAQSRRTEMIQGVRDMSFLTNIGFGAQIAEQVQAGAKQQMQTLWGAGDEIDKLKPASVSTP